MIETERLIICPLTYDQLVKYIKNDHSLEAELGLNNTSRVISEELADALSQTILPNVANPLADYLYSTLWTLVLKTENKMVGDLCFVGQPDEQGEIEIGYGTYEEFQGKGYMTEAVKAMTTWAKQQGVSSIAAGTEKNNPASFAVLQKNGFTQSGETEELFQWRLIL